MDKVLKLPLKFAQFIAATMLAALFITFLLQIFSRYVLLTPFGWTLELCLILWLWIVFFGCSFIVRDRDHVTFDILYYAVPRKIRYFFSLISILGLILIMSWAFLPTIDYIDWMKMRKTSTVRFPLTGEKIKLSYIFSIYGVFMVSLILYYIWKLKGIIKNGPTNSDKEKDKLRSIVKY